MPGDPPPTHRGTTTVGESDRPDRAVSDVVAFVFVFSIIVTSVGIVTVVGFDALRNTQAAQQAVNAERAFQALGYNLGNVHRGHAPGRNGEIDLAGASLNVTDTSNAQTFVSVDVQTDDPSALPDTKSFHAPFGAIVYDMRSRTGAKGRQTTIAYEGNAVFRTDFGNAVLKQEPGFICNPRGSDPGYAVVSIVTLDGGDTGTISTDGTVQVTGRAQPSKLLYGGNATTVSVTINRTSSFRYLDGWEEYFEQESGWSVSSSGSSITATCDVSAGSDPGRVYVRQTVIEIDFVT